MNHVSTPLSRRIYLSVIGLLRIACAVVLAAIAATALHRRARAVLALAVMHAALSGCLHFNTAQPAAAPQQAHAPPLKNPSLERTLWHLVTESSQVNGGPRNARVLRAYVLDNDWQTSNYVTPGVHTERRFVNVNVYFALQSGRCELERLQMYQDRVNGGKFGSLQTLPVPAPGPIDCASIRAVRPSPP